MSQQVANAGSAAETTNQSGSAGEEKIDFVSKSAYEDVSKDMHKFKSKLRETQAYTNELESRLKALEEEKMAEQAQWKELLRKEILNLKIFKIKLKKETDVIWKPSKERIKSGTWRENQR